MFFLRRHTLKCTTLIQFVFFFFSVCAQVHELPPNQPEQDACTALTLCANSFYTPYSYTGVGKVSQKKIKTTGTINFGKTKIN